MKTPRYTRKRIYEKIRGALAEATVTAPPIQPKILIDLPEAEPVQTPMLQIPQQNEPPKENEQNTANLPKQEKELPKTSPDEVNMAMTQKPQDIQIEVPEQKKLQLLLDRTSEFDQNYIPLTPLTPDMHSGRVFTSLLPNQGELVLPIRGEKVLASIEEEQLDQNVDEKLQKLNALMDKIRKEENVVKQEIKETKKESVEQAQTMQKTTSTPAPATPVPEKPVVEEELTQDTFHELKSDILEEQPNIQVIKPQQNVTMSLSDKKPNIIHGIVKDNTGNGLEDIILIIKNENNDPVRALKTNKIGAFSISTPLSNGYYAIETDKSKKTSLSFDIIKVEAVGQVLPSIEIIGR